MKKYVLLMTLLIMSSGVFAQKKPNLATSPPMGWNSWNWFSRDLINEDVVRETIDLMVSRGYLEAGYEYVVIDGGWRDNKLGSNNELLCHPTKFPNGIKPLVEYAHSKGLKLGLHVVPGTSDCAGEMVGALGHEEVHLKQFEGWGVDFIKLDRCGLNINNRGWDELLTREVFVKWSKMLANSKEEITYSICAYDYRPWYSQYSNMARTTGDIKRRHRARFDNDSLSVMYIADLNNAYADFAGNGYWNDPDILVIPSEGLTLEEQRSHFALWCIMSSPLFLGNNVAETPKEVEEILLNKEAIAVNQDPTEQGRRISRLKIRNVNHEIWLKNLKDGRKAVLLLNRSNKKADISVFFEDIGLGRVVEVRDVFKQEDLAAQKDLLTVSLNPHQCFFCIISEV